MPIEVARHAGFCMGVRRAVDEAQKAADSGKTIVTFGELVHNPQVIERMESMIEALLRLEKLRAKSYEMQFQDRDLLPLVSEICQDSF